MRFQRLREFSRRFGLVFSFLLLCGVLSVLSDRFLTVSNIVNVLRQSTINGIIAIGMPCVILTAGINLSVGALLALCTVVTADLLQQGLPVSLSVAAGLTLGAGLGLANGLIITKASVPPFDGF
jgi:ribose/xylose/arabinose/galactoside ABC-type transport system permease subunit